MYLNDNIQNTLRELNKISEQEVVKKQGDIYVAINVLTGDNRILQAENKLIESLIGSSGTKQILLLEYFSFKNSVVPGLTVDFIAIIPL